MKRVRKAVFPAAGLGTRFLPATKAQPKEMLPLVDKPIIQYGVEEAMAAGNQRAKLAFDVFCEKVRAHIGAYFVQMNGVDAITFTAGIGENSALVRARVCQDLDCIGAKLDPAKNQSGPALRSIHTDDSRVQIWVIPTDEEIIVARDAVRMLEKTA